MVGKISQKIIAVGVCGVCCFGIFVVELLARAQVNRQSVSAPDALLWIQGDIVCFDALCTGLCVGQIGTESAIVNIPQWRCMVAAGPYPEQTRSIGSIAARLAGD